MRPRILTLACLIVLSVLQAFAQTALVPRLKELAFAKEPQAAKALFESQRAHQSAVTPEWLAAMSWVGRAGAIGGDWDMAETYSYETMDAAEALLRTRSLDKDGEAPLPIALGAAIETLGKFYVAAGDRGQAVLFLREKRDQYSGSSIETRINKNLNLLDLAGKPMPKLDTAAWIGAEPPSAAELKGMVVVFFFWAHWCSDCKIQEPILEELLLKYRDDGLRVVAPTRFYGYDDTGRTVSPKEELDYIRGRYWRRYPLPAGISAPLNEQNFVRFGVSSTPTLVLVDRKGVVNLYHPGRMPEKDLEDAIKALL